MTQVSFEGEDAPSFSSGLNIFSIELIGKNRRFGLFGNGMNP